MISELFLSFLFVIIFILFIYFLIRTRTIERVERFEHKERRTKPFMIIGPSGVGKDTLMRILINKYPTIFTKCVSCTTRAPREGEKEGINYYYITKERFYELEQSGDIIGRFEKYDNLYGTSRQEVDRNLDNDKIVYFDYNIETANNIFKEGNIEFNYIAILPPSIEELGNRLRMRNSEDESSLQQRLAYAKKEVELIKNSKFINYVINNDDIDRASSELELKVKVLYPNFFI